MILLVSNVNYNSLAFMKNNYAKIVMRLVMNVPIFKQTVALNVIQTIRNIF